jgi:hypothetical protein
MIESTDAASDWGGNAADAIVAVIIAIAIMTKDMALSLIAISAHPRKQAISGSSGAFRLLV